MQPEIWSIGPSPLPRVKSKYLYVQEGSVIRAVARFLSEEDAQRTLAMLVAVLPEHKDEPCDSVPSEAKEALQRAFGEGV